MLVGRFYILNNKHNWTFLLHEFFFFPFFFARIFFLGIFPCMPSLPSPFCSNDSRTLSTLRATVRERFKADAILIRRNSDSQNTSGKGRGSEGSKKKLGSLGPSPPLPRLRWPHRLRREGHIQVFHAFYQILWHCIKTQTFASVFRHQCSSRDIYRFGQK